MRWEVHMFAKSKINKKAKFRYDFRRIWGSKEMRFLQYEWDHLVINATRPTTTTTMTTAITTTTTAAVKWSQVK